MYNEFNGVSVFLTVAIVFANSEHDQWQFQKMNMRRRIKNLIFIYDLYMNEMCFQLLWCGCW